MSRDEDAEREFVAAFGDPFVSEEDRIQIKRIRSNSPNLRRLDFGLFRSCSESAQWRLIGRYVAQNQHLRAIVLAGFTDWLMSHLFSELRWGSVVELSVHNNPFGREGVESMVPFLTNSSCKLTSVNFSNNARMYDECFRMIVGALNGGSIKSLVMRVCGLTDISALRNCTFPHLKVLDLTKNKISAGLSALEQLDRLEELCLNANDIGLEQYTKLSGLLRNTSTSLRKLSLQSSKLCDESIEALAGALKNNSALEELDLEDSRIYIGERGYLALLRLLCDVSSIESTYNSNHTLVTVKLPYSEHNPKAELARRRFNWMLGINIRHKRKPGKAGQIKVLQSQLNSINRKEMCLFQGIEFASTGSILADIDSCFLPNDVLAQVGKWVALGETSLARDELFDILVEMAPSLVALIDREALMENLLARKRAQIAALTAEADSLSRRLRLLKGGDEPGAKKMRRC